MLLFVSVAELSPDFTGLDLRPPETASAFIFL